MKKRGILALLLACSFALGTASMTACDLIGGNGETEQEQEQGGVNPVVETVSLNKDTLSLTVGGSETLTATVTAPNPANVSVTWSSDNESVATVDQNGKVTAHAKGSATITVTTSGNKKDTCTVTVTENPPAPVHVESVSLNLISKTLKVGENVTLTPSFTPANPDNKNVTWSSSKTNIATVDQSGKVTAVAIGKSIITVTTADGNKTAQCEITVEAAAVTTVDVTGVTVTPSATIKEGATSQLTCTVSPANATNKAVTWTSSAPAIATVDGNGLVTAVAEGTATITVTSVANKSFKATCTVTVEKVSQPVVDAEITYSYAGNECAAFEWTDSNATSANVTVQYKLKSESSYTPLSNTDKSFLVRQKNATTARVDLVGLKGGETYDFKITTSANKVLTASDVTIHSYDRSGYAHFGRSKTNGVYAGVGAYNDDGTPKSNAVIVYVNEANKNTVTANGQTGIVNILKNAGTSKPLIVRIVGTVGAATWNELAETTKGEDGNNIPILPEQVKGKDGDSLVNKYVTDRTTRKADGSIKDSSGNYYHKGTNVDITQDTLIKDGFNTLNTSVYSELKNLNSKIKYDASKDEFDSCWNDCSISNVKNVTVEGIGEDARIFQWGMTFKNSSSIEVRNLTFEDYTEDACSFEGGDTNAANLDGFSHGNIWVHHNTFEEGVNYWDVCNEQDKHDGDGSTDFKGLKNITLSYNVYNGTHKTGLIGGDNKHTTANVTFHHNAYNGCKSRLPLARQANMHMYNNYYNGTTSTDISLRAGAYALVENCYFSSTKSVNFDLQHDSTNGDGAAKVIGCTFAKKNVSYASGLDKSYFKENVARDATIANDNKFSKTFDTDSSLFYYDSVNKKSDVTVMFTAEETKTYVPQLAGVQKHGGDVTLGGAGGGSSTGTGTENPNPNPNPSGDTKTVLVINDFSGADGKTSYDIVLSGDAAGYLAGNKITASKSSAMSLGGDNGLKIQSATKLDFTCSQSVKIVIKLANVANKDNKIMLTTDNGTPETLTADSDFNIVIELQAGKTYQIGRTGTESIVASISLIVPN